VDRRERGRREFEALIGSPPEESLREVRLRSPRMYEAVLEGFGGTLAEGDLSRASRELATVAILAAAGGAEPQLATHTRAALRAGLAPSELRALCEHVAAYAGFPRGLNALTVIDEVLLDAGVPRPATLHRVSLADHSTTVSQSGSSGPPVVLIHALGMDRRMWDLVMPDLSAGRRVFAYDVRGHGSAAGAPVPGAMADLGADLLSVLDALGLERAHVVGLSYGGGVAQAAAVTAPDRFASLSLLATTGHPFDAFEGRAVAAEQEGMAAQVIPSMTRWFTPAALAVNGWGVRYARECVLRTAATDWSGAWRAFRNFDVAEGLTRLDLPALVLAGELDVATPPAVMSELANRIPGAHYRELPGAPHLQSLETPDLVTAALNDFLPA
jgi:3-oxoadipate enol-lactonase